LDGWQIGGLADWQPGKNQKLKTKEQQAKGKRDRVKQRQEVREYS